METEKKIRIKKFFYGILAFIILLNLILTNKNRVGEDVNNYFATFNKIDGVSVGDIEEIHSHEQAIKQCKDYLAEKFWSKKLVEEDDTAKAAQDLAEGRLPKQVAVIASKFSAKKYGLNILENDIHDLKKNLTLFLAVKRLDS